MTRIRQRVVDRVRQRLGVRMRSAIAASLVVAVASVFTGIAFVVAAHLILLDTVDQSAGQRANQVAATLAEPGASGLAAVIRPSPRDRTVVQVIDANGRIIAASATLSGVEPMSPLRPRAGQVRREERRLPIAHNDLIRIVALGVDTPGGPRTVLVGQSLDEVDDGTEAASGAVLVGLPLLIVVVGAATFLFVGRTLRPVEAMRRQAATISASNLHTRLPVPAAADEIAALASTMNTMLDRIEAASAAQHRFVADASHELRSPLATIHAGLDLLNAAALPVDVGMHINRMYGESGRMARLIDDLLLLARVDESGLRLKHEDVDLDDVVYAERDRILVERPNLRIEAHIAPVRASGDPHHLQRALRNLVDNATRHARSGIVLTLREDGDDAELVIADDGPGIAEADRERVFGRFVRLDENRSRLGGGTGLGLPIARDIIVAHGGLLTVQDAPGGGAALHIRLPR